MKPLHFILVVALVLSTTALAYRSNMETITWETNFATAIEKAKKDKKKLFVNFTGSDWCGWCIRLDREVFSKVDFVQYANKNFVCVKLDFPKFKKMSDEDKTQNQTLAREYQVAGFPTVLLLDADKKLVMQTGYQFGGATAYIEHLEQGIKKGK